VVEIVEAELTADVTEVTEEDVDAETDDEPEVVVWLFQLNPTCLYRGKLNSPRS
jgi:hypothetical protein